ncbi:MAG: hydroxymethylbilane synthase [Balneolaceae bacterium]
MNKPLRIGTRDSELAMWQATHVAALLNADGKETELHPIKSEGDLDLSTPLGEMGGKGVFTKALDLALLDGTIDLAVHSFKDLPTQQPHPLAVAAVLEREDPADVLVAPNGDSFIEDSDVPAVIATSSHRRKAQWLHRFPSHEVVPIRGNVQTRLGKIESEKRDGAIFAAAGLLRVGLEKVITRHLDWMVPAPAQGALAVMVREEDREIGSIVERLDDADTRLCTETEREVLTRLEAGCSAPLGAYAWLEGEELVLHAVVLTLDGSLQYDLEMRAPAVDPNRLGFRMADALLEQGAHELMEDLRKVRSE